MSAWSSYQPGDFLMFAPRTYWRLFELHNEAWGPLPLLLVLGGLLGIVWLWRRPGLLTIRAALCAAAAACGFMGWSFVWLRYAPINSAASVFAVAFLVQAAAFGALAASAGWGATTSAARRWLGFGLLVWAMLGQLLLAIAFERPWQQAEVFGLAPDPTTIATLGLLLFVRAPIGRATAMLLALAWTLAIAWCAISAATLWTMGSPQGWIPAGAALLALTAAWSGRRSRVVGTA